MRRRDENFLTASGVAIKVLDEKNTEWSGIAPIADEVQIIKDAVADIAEARKGAGSATSTGATTDKEMAESRVLDQIMMLTGFAQVYARRKGDNDLLAQMKVKRRKLEAEDDTAIVTTMEDICERLSALGTAAVPYGVTADALTALKAGIAAYDKLKDTPRSIILTRKGRNTSIPALLREIREAWKNLDALMELFRTSAPDFYTDYHNARIVIDRGGGQGGDAKADGDGPQG